MPAPCDSQSAIAAALLDPARPGPRDARFAVHRNNVVAGLVRALRETYPAVERLVGAAFFRAAAAAFVRDHPPRSPVLLAWGGDFAGWLRAFPPAATLPWLADVARLEWARVEAFHAADAAPIAAARLTALPPQALATARLAPHPSLRLVRSAWPVAGLWADVTGPRRGGLDMRDAETALVVRPGWDVETRAIAAPTADFLAAVLAGRPLGAIAQAAAEGAFALTEQLAAAFAAGLIVDLT